MDINFHQLNLTRGSFYLPLPDCLVNKRAIINPQNEYDEECFKWSVIAGLHYADITSHPKRISNLKRFEYDYSWDGLEFPLSVKGISELERRNDVIVNVTCRKKIGFTSSEERNTTVGRKSLTY